MDTTASKDENNTTDTKVCVSFSVLSLVHNCISCQYVSCQLYILIKQGTCKKNAFVVLALQKPLLCNSFAWHKKLAIIKCFQNIQLGVLWLERKNTPKSVLGQLHSDTLKEVYF